MAGNNIFPRYTGGRINLEGRVGGGGAGPSDLIVVSAVAMPELLALNQTATVTIKLTKNGLALGGYTVDITNTNQAVVATPANIYAAENGVALFSITGLGIGSADLRAMLTIEGMTYYSDVMSITVSQMEAPENYDATGYGRFMFSVEPALADGLYPRIKRLSHQRQVQLYGDDGLFYAQWFSNANVTFIPKSLLTK